ncbi:MAG: GNAT family N-acetyltransferase [Deltaproteobacteria bacterium]|nr:GNAT family N-acetyltransferase [Deltaproteobacteria bacterium]
MNDADQLMTDHVDSMYVHDAEGHLRFVNDGGRDPAPRFWLGRTEAGPTYRFGSNLPPPLIERLTMMCGQERASPTLGRWPARWSEYVARLQEHAPVQRTWAGPTYVCPTAMGLRGEAVRISAANRELLSGSLEGWRADVDDGCPLLAVVVDGRAVSVCASVRISRRAEAAGVETVPEHRRQGHAAAVVAAWAADVRSRGSVPMYSTSWDNHASQAVARSLGLRCFGVECHIT